MEDDLGSYLRGERLYGDDFDARQIARWFEDEKEASVDLWYGDHTTYLDHAVNSRHGFRFLPPGRFARVLGFGSAYGEEFRPILSRVDSITIVESSDRYARREIGGVPAVYVRPRPDGTLPFPDDQFDLETCLGVLHHIPNVTWVVGELYRCLRPGGSLLVHEPTVSMGDWTKPRPGLTPRERGIPPRILARIATSTGFEVVHERTCCSEIMNRLANRFRWAVKNSMPMVVIDEVLCRFLLRNPPYHPSERVKNLMPLSVFYVLRKPGASDAARLTERAASRGSLSPPGG